MERDRKMKRERGGHEIGLGRVGEGVRNHQNVFDSCIKHHFKKESMDLKELGRLEKGMNLE